MQRKEIVCNKSSQERGCCGEKPPGMSQNQSWSNEPKAKVSRLHRRFPVIKEYGIKIAFVPDKSRLRLKLGGNTDFIIRPKLILVNLGLFFIGGNEDEIRTFSRRTI